MIDNYLYILFIPILIYLNYFLIKKNILLNFSGQKHQVYTYKNKVPLSGGIFLGMYFLVNFNSFDLNLIIFLFIFLFIGLLADLTIIKSPIIRFYLQIIFLIIFIINQNLSINDIRIDFLNILLENYYFNIFFVLFCILVFLNGSNFIDGNNCLAIGYFVIIFLAISILNHYNFIIYNSEVSTSFLIILTILLIFNFAGKLYLGDGGIYLLSIFSCFILITIYNTNNQISPYFIANLLWYPAFEILFSLIRKLRSRLSPMDPDIMHLHQLIFYFYKQKLNLKIYLLNSLTGISINIYNTFVIYLCCLNISNTKIQTLYLILSVSIYFFCYIYFLKFKRSFKNKKFNH